MTRDRHGARTVRRESGHAKLDPESGADAVGATETGVDCCCVETEMRAGFRTRTGEAEARVVLQGFGIKLALETRSCHVARTGREGGDRGGCRSCRRIGQIGRAHV